MLYTILSTIELSYKAIELRDYSEPQQAMLWFIPLIIIGVIGLFSLIIIISGDSPSDTFKYEKKVDLAILGPNEAGKTTLWNFLKGCPASTVYNETDGNEEMSFVASSITWKVKICGSDINGNGDFIRNDWEKMIEKANMVILVFDAYKYLHDENSQRDVNERMQLVMSTVSKQTDGKKRGVWLLGSFADLLEDRKTDWSKIIGGIKKKKYCEISHNNACFNLTKEKEMKEYFEKMFNN